VEQNRKTGQNPPRVVAPTEEEEEPYRKRCFLHRFWYIGLMIPHIMGWN